MERSVKTHRVAAALQLLFGELVDGPSGSSYMLNPGDGGLLKSLRRLAASDASRAVARGAPVCAHVEHLRYGLSLLNRWSTGDDPFSDADWSASWRVTQVSEREWDALRADLEIQVRAWSTALGNLDAKGEDAIELTIASIAHLAYHLGAIRQIAPLSRGPTQ